ncbi:MAG TPA: PD-(D/E)XK nuclease family protein [Vicinamibacterales bacterium]|jgi:RecB family exonuclease
MTPRSVRLLRAPDLRAVPRAVGSLVGAALRARDCAVLVPSRAAAQQLRHTLERLAFASPPSAAACEQGVVWSLVLPDLVTRDEWYRRLYERAGWRDPWLSPIEREVLLGAAARETVEAGVVPPFRVRPGLVAEMLAFYDALARQQRTIETFERIVVEDLEPRADIDRGAERLLRQTRFLVAAFRAFERRVAASGALDESSLRRRLLESRDVALYRHVVVTIGDRISEPSGGLHPADFDLLTRLPHLEAVDIVATEAELAAGLHDRLRDLLPELEEEAMGAACPRPVLVAPRESDVRFFRSRDREEELRAIARRIKCDRRAQSGVLAPAPLDRTAIVFKRPLPYVYLAAIVFEHARIEFQAADALPLAAEPFAGLLDLIFALVESRFGRTALVALLKSPHFADRPDTGVSSRLLQGTSGTGVSSRLLQGTSGTGVSSRLLQGTSGTGVSPRLLQGTSGTGVSPRLLQGTSGTGVSPVAPAEIAALDRALGDLGYLGDPEALARLAETWAGDGAAGARAAARVAAELAPLMSVAPVSAHLTTVLAFLRSHEHFDLPDEMIRQRHLRARGAVIAVLETLRAAALAHDDPPARLADVAAAVRRWLEAETFSPRRGTAGVQFADAQAARYGDFDTVHLVGLAEGDWPEPSARNIFYPAFLLAELGWPSDAARLAAVRAAFVDLLCLPSASVFVSTFTLEDDSIVNPSALLEELDGADVSVVRVEESSARVFVDEAITSDPIDTAVLEGDPSDWLTLRLSRSPGTDASFHGAAGPGPLPVYTVTAIDRYLDCPFKYFAATVLRLPEDVADESSMSPKVRGRFVHEVLRAFFTEWQAAGGGPITVTVLDQARGLFASIAERQLSTLPKGEAALERLRLLGSVAAAGLGEIVLAAEAARPEPVRERLLEYTLDGLFSIANGDTVRRVRLRGKADRVDLFADGRFRVIDYKIGKMPDAGRSVQLPIYAICVQQQLERTRGGRWEIAEASYMAFGERKPVRAVVEAGPGAAESLADGQARLIGAIDRIERGEFPPQPATQWLCSTCAFASVCRKDYVVADEQA